MNSRAAEEFIFENRSGRNSSREGFILILILILFLSTPPYDSHFVRAFTKAGRKHSAIRCHSRCASFS